MINDELAFACAASNGHQPGMTRRQWLAGLAMQGIVSNSHWVTESESNHWKECISADAYLLADFMIAHEEKERRITEGEK